MNSIIRVIIKLVLTIIIFSFFSGVFRGCSEAAHTEVTRGMGILFATIILGGALFGVWSYNPKKKKDQTDIKLNKD